MALSKVTANGITDNAVTTAKIATGAVEESDLAANAVTSAKINDGTVVAADLASSLDLSSKTVTIPPSATSTVDQNIALLGFKMAVNEGLTVFNLVDGIVDEFHDESGTDEGEGSNDNYCSSSDFYKNVGDPVAISAGLGVTSVTEGDTSTAGTNPAHGSGTSGVFTVPTGMTSVNMQVWGAAGAGNNCNPLDGGGGGYAEGTLAVTASQTLHVLAGEGGEAHPNVNRPFLNGGGGAPLGAGGGGLAGVFALPSPQLAHPAPVPGVAPNVYIVAGSGGAAGGKGGGGPSSQIGGHGGGGGGLTGNHGNGQGEQTNNYSVGGSDGFGGGGDQEQGGEGGNDPVRTNGNPGDFLNGAANAGGAAMSGGGAGYYGGGGGADGPGTSSYAAGGGSSYYGHPQVTSGSTEDGGANDGGDSGGLTQPGYVSGTGEGSGSNASGEDGFVLLTGTKAGSTTSTTIVSNAFTASSEPSTSRIVVFQEDIGSITLNTDIIASISRDGGSNFTNATLSDSGYVVGASGQRILTGTATISGQPSGTSMRWKLALANNQSKVHGVSLQWK